MAAVATVMSSRGKARQHFVVRVGIKALMNLALVCSFSRSHVSYVCIDIVPGSPKGNRRCERLRACMLFARAALALGLPM
eukprot:4462137-Pleurochrysis_carterae.AAC.1